MGLRSLLGSLLFCFKGSGDTVSVQSFLCSPCVVTFIWKLYDLSVFYTFELSEKVEYLCMFLLYCTLIFLKWFLGDLQFFQILTPTLTAILNTHSAVSYIVLVICHLLLVQIVCILDSAGSFYAVSFLFLQEESKCVPRRSMTSLTVPWSLQSMHFVFFCLLLAKLFLGECALSHSMENTFAFSHSQALWCLLRLLLYIFVPSPDGFCLLYKCYGPQQVLSAAVSSLLWLFSIRPIFWYFLLLLAFAILISFVS